MWKSLSEAKNGSLSTRGSRRLNLKQNMLSNFEGSFSDKLFHQLSVQEHTSIVDARKNTGYLKA